MNKSTQTPLSNSNIEQLLDNTEDRQHEEQDHQKDHQVVQDEPS